VRRIGEPGLAGREADRCQDAAGAADRVGGGDGAEERHCGGPGLVTERDHTRRIQGEGAAGCPELHQNSGGREAVPGAREARLEFLSAESESGSYKGPTAAAANSGGQPPRDPEERGRMGEGSMVVPDSLVTVLRGWGQLKANDSGWPTFDGRYASYPRFKREWTAYRETDVSLCGE
jgi:hypothetical protein